MDTVTESGLYDPRQSEDWSPECDLLTDGLDELEAARLYTFAKRLHGIFRDGVDERIARKIPDALSGKAGAYVTIFGHLRDLCIRKSVSDLSTPHDLCYYSGISCDYGLQTDQASSIFEAYRNSINFLASSVQEWCDLINRMDEEGFEVFFGESGEFLSFQEFYADVYNLMFAELFDTTIVLQEDVGIHSVGSNGVADITIEAKDYMVCKTRPITLTSEGLEEGQDELFDLDIDFGPMYMYLIADETLTKDIRDTNLSRLVLIATECPRPKSGHIHPHVSNPHNEGFPCSMCLGEAQAPIKSAMERGSVSDLMFISFAVINSYNPHAPYVPLDQWYDGEFCPVCDGPLVGEDLVTCSVSGQVVHRDCSVEMSTDIVSLAQTWHCNSCGDLVVGATSRGGLCEPCCSELEEEEAAAQVGEFICPNCRTRHTSVADHRIQISGGYVVCSECARPLGLVQQGFARRQGYIIRQRNRDGSVEEVTVLEGVGSPRRNNRPTPSIAVRERCDCGALVPVTELSQDPFTGSRICGVCDPDGLGLSPALFQDIGYLEGWLECFKATHIDQYTRDFLSDTMSFLAYGFSTETAGAIVRKLRLWEKSGAARYNSATETLSGKAAFWQNIIREVTDYPFIIYFSEGEELHDQTQASRRPQQEVCEVSGEERDGYEIEEAGDDPSGDSL